MEWINKLSKDYHQTATDLCHIMKKQGSDKGLGWHNYTTLYSILFSHMRHTPIHFFEVGLGTNNIHVPSNMGANGIPGASLRGWKEYFDHADTKVYGADVDKGILFQEPNIWTYYVDQCNAETIATMWNQIPEEQFDVVLDDGLHRFDANWNFFVHSVHKVKKGGFYIVEDLLPETARQFRERLQDIQAKYNPSFLDVIQIPHSTNDADNTVFVMQL